MVTILCDDVLHWAETTPPIGAHALLCDPPYELGFMGKAWDRSGIAFRPDTWRALAQHLLPGAFGMACASSRGYHRLACAIEDAGLILQPTIFLWTYGSGFPKATRIAHEYFAGHRYGGQALKPAAEPILCFQKPYAGRPVDSITETGAGALWIDGGRVVGPEPHRNYGRPSGTSSWFGPDGLSITPTSGRWPPNFALCHLPDCQPLGPQRVPGTKIPGPGMAGKLEGYGNKNAHGCRITTHTAPDGTETVQAYDCAPECPVRQLNEQVGERHVAAHGPQSGKGIWGSMPSGYDSLCYEEGGPVSRFFPCFDWALDIVEHLAAADPVFYAGKASPSERSEGLRVRNTHSTVKPLTLCTWLATLLLPPKAYAPRRLLNPFAGSGSEAIGATLAGWEIVVGIEQDPATVTLAQQRFTYWHTQIAAQLSLGF